MRAAQERLSKALEEGASDEEIQKLMQELRQALAQFMEQLSKQAQNQPPMQGLDRNSQFMTPQDLEQMLRNLENMARSGNRDMAQQMLSQLRDLLDRLQSGRMADQGQSQRFGQMMDEFGNIIGRQQQLLDDTFGQQRRQGERGQRGRASAARKVSAVSRVRASSRARQGDGDQQGALGDRQRELRDMLGRLQSGMREFGLNAPGQFGGAGEAMERAERALRDGDLDGASQEETRALEQLRQGAREMAQQMLRQMPSRYGLNDIRRASSTRWAGRRSAPMVPIRASASRCPTRSTSSGPGRSWRSCAAASARPRGRRWSSSISSACSSASEARRLPVLPWTGPNRL